MAVENEETHTESETLQLSSSFPSGRVKRIMKLDRDINKINSDALFLISNATDLFLKFLTEKSLEVAVEKKRKTIKLDHLRVAVKRHRPTSDFLLDSLPMPSPSVQISSKTTTDRTNKSSDKKKNCVPAGTRGIDTFFKKCS